MMSFPDCAPYVVVLAIYVFACTGLTKDEANKVKLRCAFIIGLSILFGVSIIFG